MRPVRQRGFTLIELMIVVVIASILASIAIPSYLNQTRQARRAEAKQLLLDAASRQERIFSEFGQYTATVGSGGSNCGPQNNQTCGLNLGMGISSNGFYQLTITQPTNNSLNSARFSMTATALGDQANDACGDFTLNQQGVRGVSGGATMTAQQCWSR